MNEDWVGHQQRTNGREKREKSGQREPCKLCNYKKWEDSVGFGGTGEWGCYDR